MTYWAEAQIVSTGEWMQDVGLTSEQIDRLRAAQERGIIRELKTGADIDLVAAFGGRH